MPDSAALSFWHLRTTVITVRVLLVAAFIGISFHAFAPGEQMIVDTGWDVSNHLISFLVLAGGLDFAFPERTFGAKDIAVLLAYGIGIELVQSFIPYRFGSISDIFADLLGLAIYILFLPVLRRLPLVRTRWESTPSVRSGSTTRTPPDEKKQKN